MTAQCPRSQAVKGEAGAQCKTHQPSKVKVHFMVLRLFHRPGQLTDDCPQYPESSQARLSQPITREEDT